MRYEIRYRHVRFDELGRIYIEYRYTASFRMTGRQTVRHDGRGRVSDNRAVLRRDEESEALKFISGL